MKALTKRSRKDHEATPAKSLGITKAASTVRRIAQSIQRQYDHNISEERWGEGKSNIYMWLHVTDNSNTPKDLRLKIIKGVTLNWMDEPAESGNVRRRHRTNVGRQRHEVQNRLNMSLRKKVKWKHNRLSLHKTNTRTFITCIYTIWANYMCWRVGTRIWLAKKRLEFEVRRRGHVFDQRSKSARHTVEAPLTSAKPDFHT